MTDTRAGPDHLKSCPELSRLEIPWLVWSPVPSTIGTSPYNSTVARLCRPVSSVEHPSFRDECNELMAVASNNTIRMV
jgi:hypothetical protein